MNNYSLVAKLEGATCPDKIAGRKRVQPRPPKPQVRAAAEHREQPAADALVDVEPLRERVLARLLARI